MSAVASVHIADVSAATGLRLLARAPKPGAVDGLLRADIGAAAPMTTGLPRPGFRRMVMCGFWEGDDALSAFLADHPIAEALDGGWRARLEPLRAYGSWPGLPPDTPRHRTTEYEGPSVVVTLGRLRLSQAVAFFRAGRRAQAAVIGAQGLVWATGFSRPPFVATCSLWSSTEALHAYAYGSPGHGHASAIDDDRRRRFHHESAFIRFRPLEVSGSLGGKHPLPELAFGPG